MHSTLNCSKTIRKMMDRSTHRIHVWYIYANIGCILMGSMLPYIAAPWILWGMDCRFTWICLGFVCYETWIVMDQSLSENHGWLQGPIIKVQHDRLKNIFPKPWFSYHWIHSWIWLVVYLPLWKIWKLLGWLFSIYGKKKHVPNHQPVDIDPLVNSHIN